MAGPLRYNSRVDSGKAAEAYTRSEIRRILGLNENSLRSWERLGLAEVKQSYSFADLISLKTLQSLRANRISAKTIRDALHQLRLRLADVTRPLDELKIVSDGRRIAVELPGERMEALTGQMLFDFDAKTLRPGATLEFRQDEPEVSAGYDNSESWFQYALELERSGAAPNEIIDVYRRVVDRNPDAAGAWVNMGTLHYREHLLAMAEKCYNEALQVYPEYALAHYNLGNICEETGRLDEAVRHYRSALRFEPNYGDAHFNLALAQERRQQFVEAIKHWQAYLEYDPASPWSEIARRNRERVLQLAAAGDHAVGRSLRKPVRDSTE